LGTGANSAEIFRRPVTKLEYVDEETLVSGSEDGTMRVWSVATGAQKEELDGGSFAFSKDNSSEQKVVKYSITFKEDLLLISEDQSVVAFFRAPHVISCIGTTGERIGVGCKNGEVLQLRAPWLV
jgi:WD40 repeat protein